MGEEVETKREEERESQSQSLHALLSLPVRELLCLGQEDRKMPGKKFNHGLTHGSQILIIWAITAASHGLY